MYEINKDDLDALLDEINKGGLGRFYYASPFASWVPSSFNKKLSPDFFFQDLFVNPSGKGEEIHDKISDEINGNIYTTILLFGSRGSGKTTFLHSLKRENYNKNNFEIIDFDDGTGHPVLHLACQKFAALLFARFDEDVRSNDRNHINFLFKLYSDNVDIINKMDVSSNISKIFAKIKNIYCSMKFDKEKHDIFRVEFESLYFSQQLLIVILWDICSYGNTSEKKRKTYCLDNLDAMVSRDEVQMFYRSYFEFVRDIGGVINEMNDKLRNKMTPNYVNVFAYEQFFTFVICARDTTWSKLSIDERPGDVSPNGQFDFYIRDHIFSSDISNIFLKRKISYMRHKWLQKYRERLVSLAKKSELFWNVLTDLEKSPRNSIFRLFNNDYRFCMNVLHDVVFNSNISGIVSENYYETKYRSSYGSRGIILKGLFDLFNSEGYFEKISVLLSNNDFTTSISRWVLTCLSQKANANTSITVKDVIDEFDKIMPSVPPMVIRKTILGMFALRNTKWGHLVTLSMKKKEEIDKINNELPDTAVIRITEAGFEHLDSVTTHFEFFSCRVQPANKGFPPLFTKDSMKFHGDKYVFEKIIEAVLDSVEKCCKRLDAFIKGYVLPEMKIEEFLETSFVYAPLIRPYRSGKRQEPRRARAGLHGGRILDTHITYLDHFRSYAMKTHPSEGKIINEKMVSLIERYIQVAKDFPDACSDKNIFEDMTSRIENIKGSKCSEYIRIYKSRNNLGVN